MVVVLGLPSVRSNVEPWNAAVLRSCRINCLFNQRSGAGSFQSFPGLCSQSVVREHGHASSLTTAAVADPLTEEAKASGRTISEIAA